MNGQKHFDKPLILDSPRLVSKTQYYTEWGINILGWIAWMIFIRPLIILVLWYVAYRFFNYQMFQLEGIENPEYFGIGACVLIGIYLTMLGWSRYNAWRFRGKDRRTSRGEATPGCIAEYYKVRPEDISTLQKSKNIDVYFLEDDIIEIDDGKGIRVKALYAPMNQAKHHDKNIKL
ncbi:MAG TPA: poly-beta-1,6-N-acetyl-D-glucosamine biosynthesis protein PgaD [Lentisphaeria bacterium]|nr:MAG: poly-beta-1,6-N-acetyl-D-glucosamine biosynthesis protein PgaD [Lentisphaerae bacterium GWF2_50_93]HCE46881.1 poly-beta-1,6-N-acetyl-D-glucosamine biosynthesis protein PgaD [Lentisphaeria bacterium]